MGAKRVINGVHVVPMGMANAFLIEGDDGLTLIDAGFPGKEAAVFQAIRGLGRSPDQLKHLIFTHGHPDHIGSAAAIVRETSAKTHMHPLDIPMSESGGLFRPMRPAPGLLGQVLCRLFFDPDERMEPVAIDQPLSDGEILPIAGGIKVIHTPGHCAGHVALLWRPGRMLFAGDVCTNLMGLPEFCGNSREVLSRLLSPPPPSGLFVFNLTILHAKAHRYSRTKNKRSPFVSWTRPRTFRRNTIS